MSSGELECLADCGTTHTILRHRQLFSNLTPTYSSVTTMAGPSNLVQGRGPAQFLLPNGTIIDVTHALYAPRGNRTLLSFKDIEPMDTMLKRMMRMGKNSFALPLMTAAESAS
ncbi:hypothetical protein M0R45_018196 [Rubus argutus]|uniref:Retrovirus-related Pol polyprotein from transposon TNT 1-94-like beta-barrel domain-containing protein n=1 Tax=Rubus argutus TaxID=59490 RepID=A0AAW1X3K7_RUBAR